MSDKLTAEQEALLNEYGAKASAFAHGGDTSINTEKAVEGIRFLYKMANVKAPDEILFFDSPAAAKKDATARGASNPSLDWMGAGFDSGWVHYYRFMRDVLGVSLDAVPEFKDYENFIDSGVYGVMLFDEVAYAVRRPASVKTLPNGRLHCSTGPAVTWADGEEQYFLNGIAVPKWLVMTDSGKIDPKLALTEKNVDVQREIIRKIGAERMLKATKAKTLDVFVDNHKNGGNEYKLMEMKVGEIDRKYLYFEHASVPGVFYAQPVPPTITKALHARAWMANVVELEDLDKLSDKKIKELLPTQVS